MNTQTRTSSTYGTNLVIFVALLLNLAAAVSMVRAPGGTHAGHAAAVQTQSSAEAA